jgi:hypothetical protein
MSKAPERSKPVKAEERDQRTDFKPAKNIQNVPQAKRRFEPFPRQMVREFDKLFYSEVGGTRAC